MERRFEKAGPMVRIQFPPPASHINDPRWVWHAAAALGTDAVYPPQYLRARPEHWPGAALTPHRPTPERS